MNPVRLVLSALWLSSALCTNAARGNESIPIETVGIDGHYRVGCWTPLRLAGRVSSTSDSLGIETLDGDGVRVIYQQSSEFAQGASGYMIAGSEGAPLVVRRGDTVLHGTRFPLSGVPAAGPSMIPASMPWIIVIGDPLGMDTIGANSLLGRASSIGITRPRLPTSLPDHAIGYDGVDLVMITHSGIEFLSQLSAQQSEALQSWFLGGGRMLLCLGETSTEDVARVPWLKRFLPESVHDVETVMFDASAVESYTSSQIRLEPFRGINLPKDVGQVLILGRTTRKVSTPIAVEYKLGLGRSTVVAGDLESPEFVAWPERLDLLTRLISDVLPKKSQEAAAVNRRTSYSDLAGQMRGALDQFAVKRRFSFSRIALIILALIALLGPLDYFLVNRFLRRPPLGWLTFPFVAIGLSGLLVWFSTPDSTSASAAMASRSEKGSPSVQSNRVEFVDVDLASGTGRGFVWSYFYSHEARRIGLHGESTPELKMLTNSIQSRLVAPFGYPGPSLGGIQIVGDASRMPPYQVQLDGTTSQKAKIVELAIAPRSSKSLVTRYRFDANLTRDVKVSRRRGSELLEGSFTNPLPYDVLDGMLVFRNWAYLLPTRFHTGATIASIDTLRQKNFRWQLSRQQAVKSDSETEAWNPTDSQSVGRIAEMLMFHQAVGGEHYTHLNHDILSELDLSSLLTDEQSMLIGRLERPLSRLSIHDANQSTNETEFPEATGLTLIRVSIPIRNTSRY
jgi:hypothetical protein